MDSSAIEKIQDYVANYDYEGIGVQGRACPVNE